MIRLGVNIDHVATLRNARGEGDPSLIELAIEAQDGGADGLTVHLREDRRHIVDEDLPELKKHLKLPINLEIAVIDEMFNIAKSLNPKSVCLVPEKREEVTTEGGLDLKRVESELASKVKELKDADIEVFAFVEPEADIVELSAKLNLTGVELHTGAYSRTVKNAARRREEILRIRKASALCSDLALELHAGHGLNYQNIKPFIEIQNLTEVNIGHAIISRALKVGMASAVSSMRALLL